MAKRLPKKLSALMKVALTDLELVEKDSRYKVNMDIWHDGIGTDNALRPVCTVCLAGSVMAKSLKTNPKEWTGPGDFDENDNADKLRALNGLRTGDFEEAFNYVGLDLDDYNLPSSFHQDDFKLDEMSNSRRKEWREHMCTVIGILEAEGL